VISNLITHILDLKLNKLANDLRCTYTRYADDLTFSTNEKEFPQQIARLVRGSDDKWVAGDRLLHLVYCSGFKLNHEKTRMQRRDSRQDTTGLIVNQKINVRHEYYKQVRAMCHHLFNHGFAHLGDVPVSNSTVGGMISFIYQIRRLRSLEFKEGERKAFFRSDQAGFTKLYGRFLDYQSFYGMPRPTIICEGKTDNIYLLSAIKVLHAKFPKLIAPGTKVPMQVQFFNYNHRSALFQDLSGGGEEMHRLLREFRDRIKYFKHGAAQPVIMVIDNDAASKGIFTYIGTIHSKPVTGMDPFYHVFENLYVVPVPKPAGGSAVIEDLFDPSVMKPLNGRTFNSSNKKFDQKVYYGKSEFANEIVAPQRATINFSKFEPMLTAFCDVIDHFATLSKMSAPASTTAMPATIAVP
jgi:hypothetical protein